MTPATATPAPITTWRATTTAPDLLPGQLHLWRIEAGPAADPDTPIGVLSQGEWRRAERFRLETHRRRYLITQASLRAILASYLGTDPAALAFEPGPHGKPYLSGRRRTIQFNLTTCDDLALLAVTQDQEIGIDCEQIRHRHRLEGLAAMVFPPAECRLLEGLPPEERLVRFYQGWTRLEAQVKATGLGLYWGRGLSRESAPHTQGFVPAEGFVAAVAAATPLPHPADWLALRWSPPDRG